MDFSESLQCLKKRYKMCRNGWNGKDMWIGIYFPEVMGGTMTKPYIYIKTAKGDRIPWLASQEDLLAEDWKVADNGYER